MTNGTAATPSALLANDQHLAGAKRGRQLGVVAFQSSHRGVVGFGDAAQGLALLNFVVFGGSRTRRRGRRPARLGGFDRSATPIGGRRLLRTAANYRLVDEQRPSHSH